VNAKDFIAAVGPAARQSEPISRIPAVFVIADAALESGFGSSALAQKAFNLFGVKADATWRGAVLSMPTREYVDGQWQIVESKWRQYKDWAGSIQDHAAFLISNPRYHKAFATTTPEDFARAVAAAGYATDPQYAEKIIKIMHADLAEGATVAEPTKPNSSVNTIIAGSGATSLTAVLAWVFDGTPKPVPAYVTAFAAGVIATVAHAVYNKWFRNLNTSTGA
jgi:flagellum-specific peptidoglycan hydrolase FlgJ